MSKLREILKRNRIIVGMYENAVMLKTYLQAWHASLKSGKHFSKEDRLKVQKYKNIHKGKRCFIVATGPSQNADDLNMLKDEITFTVNSGYKAYQKTNWRATYYVLMDENSGEMLKASLSEYNEYAGVFYSQDINNYIPIGIETGLVADAKELFMINTIWNKLFPKIFPIARFSEDISKKVYCGKTVVYACIQIAAYMGFDEIYLTGVDCNYGGERQHSDMMDYHLSKEAKERVINKSGNLMLIQFGALADVLKKRGVHVYNATRGGKLEAFQRVNFDELFKGC
ncbi:MAG: DUF115 domain-containing protein [Lachnospiraceae bacterium]|nr:DUF115 domain-containing protein [Lachnospiraceae bacterium]